MKLLFFMELLMAQWVFQAFMNLIGMKHYFGKNEYDNDADFDGAWGIWDEEFLQFMATKLTTFKEPFLGTVFTLSSHDPYKNSCSL